MASAGTLADLDRRIGATDNLARRPGLIKSATGTRIHAGGGSDFPALFNGTAGNGQGGEGTENDGRTFVGLGEGNTLEIVFDPAAAPAGVTLQTIRTYAGHHDARASQHYEILAAAAGTPDRFVKLAEVAHDAVSGLNEVTVQSATGAPLATNAAALRFVFKDGPLGFNVYREISLLGQAATPK